MMPTRHALPIRFDLGRLALALISAAFAMDAGAAAGRVDFASGGVTVASRNGQARPLGKGAEVDSGDTVRTTGDGRAQIRFSDGSYVSVQPNTDFAISDYKYEGKDDDHGFFGLLKGAMRTVTGAVGKVNRNSYRITTPTATVGIRGTGGVIQVLNDGSTLVVGTSGIWSLTNPAGSIDVPAGVSGLAPTEPNTPPKETNTQPQTSTAPPVEPQKPVYSQGDQVTESGTAVVGVVPLVTGPGYSYVTAFSWFGGGRVMSNPDAFATFDAQGKLLSWQASNGETLTLNGTHAEFGTDGILAWGRWIGNVQGKMNIDGLLTVDETYDQNQGLHYVIGIPTPVMPTTGTATYSLAGATSPTNVAGGVAPGTLAATSNLSVNFGTQTVIANLDVTIAGNGYNVNGRTTYSGSQFFISPTVTPTAGSACTQGCSGQLSGFFAGPSAERAGVGYQVNDGFNNLQILGAAAFKKN